MKAINFELRPMKSEAQQPAYDAPIGVIYVRMSQPGGKRVRFTTGLKVDVRMWDRDSQRLVPVDDPVLPTQVKATDLNLSLAGIELRLIELLSERHRMGSVPGRGELASACLAFSAFARTGATTGSLITLYGKYVDQAKQVCKPNYILVLSQVGRHLSAFLKQNQLIHLTVSEVTEEHLAGFRAYLETGRGRNTVRKVLYTLKGMLRWAADRGHAVQNSAMRYKMPQGAQSWNRASLSSDELRRWLDFKLDPHTPLGRAHRVFGFVCLTGPRDGDVRKMTWANVCSDKLVDPVTGKVRSFYTLKYMATKTERSVEVPLVAEALAILQLYKGRCGQSLLPMMSNQAYNRLIKQVGEMVGIDSQWQQIKYRGAQRIERTVPKYEAITSHSARHTFIAVLEEKQITLTEIGHFVGHSSVEQTAKYVKSPYKNRAARMLNAFG
jgi:integrase